MGNINISAVNSAIKPKHKWLTKVVNLQGNSSVQKQDFQTFLLVLIICRHHRETLIGNFSRNVVLTKSGEQTVKFGNSLFRLRACFFRLFQFSGLFCRGIFHRCTDKFFLIYHQISAIYYLHLFLQSSCTKSNSCWLMIGSCVFSKICHSSCGSYTILCTL